MWTDCAQIFRVCIKECTPHLFLQVLAEKRRGRVRLSSENDNFHASKASKSRRITKQGYLVSYARALFEEYKIRHQEANCVDIGI